MTLLNDYVVAGTGSRRIKTADLRIRNSAWDQLIDRLDHLRALHGDRLVVMSGFAEGWDEAVAKAAIKLNLRLWAAIPNRGYGRWYWSTERSLTDRDRQAEFTALRDRAWRVTYVMEDVHHTSALKLDGVHANFLRNNWMVTGSLDFPGADDFLVLGPVKPGSGTDHCVKAIKRAGKWRDDMVLSPEPAQAALPI